MIKTVARVYHYTPEVLWGLYVDACDIDGLEFWYDDAAEVDKELKKSTPNPLGNK